MKGRKALALLVLLLGFCVAAYAGIHLIKAARADRESNAVYDDLRDRAEERTDSPVIDFEPLKAINSDIVALLRSPGTVIDYPVMKADDYSYYLRRLPEGTANTNGSLFIDYNNASDFSEPLTVIYGHHMKSGKMFGSLKGYKAQVYYEEHPTMYLYTEKQNYRIELLYGCVISARQWRDKAFMYAENVDALIAYAAYNTTFKSYEKYEEGNRIVALSTCSYEFDGARYVVIGRLSQKSQ